MQSAKLLRRRLSTELARLVSSPSSRGPAVTDSSLGAITLGMRSATRWDAGSGGPTMPKASSKARSNAGMSSRREMSVARPAQ